MIAPISIVFEIRLQEIGKEKQFQHHEHDEKLDQDNLPHLFSPPGHVGKTVIVKPEGSFEYIHIFGQSAV